MGDLSNGLELCLCLGDELTRLGRLAATLVRLVIMGDDFVSDKGRGDLTSMHSLWTGLYVTEELSSESLERGTNLCTRK